MNKRLLYIFVLILLAAITRMIPHPYNFAPLGAMSLFGAAHFANKKLAFLLPLLAFFISDLLVNNILYSGYYNSFVIISPGYIWTYGAMLLIVLAGIFIFKKITFSRIIAGGLSASVIFFIISNLGVWVATPTYPATIQGLVACYIAAIPFFPMAILGDLVYSGILFGTYELASRKITELRTA